MEMRINYYGFYYRLFRSQCRFDTIWVIVDTTKQLYDLLLVETTFIADDYARLYIRKILRQHSVPMFIISDRGA